MARDRSTTRHLVTAALISALLAASAWIAIPVGAVPVTLQTFFVVLAALLLPAPWAAASIAVYLALGAIGLPVFSGGHGGFGVLVGPTGGYLFGFLAGATLGALVRTLAEKRLAQVVADVLGAAVVIAVTYAVGTLQLALVLHLTAAQAVLAGVVPFVVADLVKAAAAVAAAGVIRRALGR